MLDMQDDSHDGFLDKLTKGPLDSRALMAALAALSPKELEELEDDLDFAQFTGVKSERIQAVLEELTVACAA